MAVFLYVFLLYSEPHVFGLTASQYCIFVLKEREKNKISLHSLHPIHDMTGCARLSCWW